MKRAARYVRSTCSRRYLGSRLARSSDTHQSSNSGVSPLKGLRATSLKCCSAGKGVTLLVSRKLTGPKRTISSVTTVTLSSTYLTNGSIIPIQCSCLSLVDRTNVQSPPRARATGRVHQLCELVHRSHGAEASGNESEDRQVALRTPLS